MKQFLQKCKLFEVSFHHTESGSHFVLQSEMRSPIFFYVRQAGVRRGAFAFPPARDPTLIPLQSF